ncbi:helix-turn-helix transcriptional regulator [Chromobacterium haemolyticum]|uniref:helix-turn-helix transcriptional regulator n=1 Tax=Chromobacterium haemolyticum TaxID=394935 RepID=UPI0040571C90
MYQENLYHACMRLSEWVRAARQHAHLTQERLGELVNKTKGNISAWENGRHEPSFDQIESISRITGYPMPVSDVEASNEVVLQAASVKDMLDELERRGESEVAKLFFEYARRKEKGG